MALDPEQEVVRRLPPGECLDPEGELVACREHLCRSWDPRAFGVGGRRETPPGEVLLAVAGVTLVPWVRQNDDRLAAPSEVEDCLRRSGRKRQQQPLAF